MSNCENCRFRAKYDQNPRSILGRIWKWHTGWCPGWKSYLTSLPDEKRAAVVEKYGRSDRGREKVMAAAWKK